MKKLAFILVLLLTKTAYSSNILDKLGILGNANRPEVWQDQMGGYVSGGSIHARVPSSNLQILTLELPSLSMGCSGIDLFGGGFGYINSKQLEGLLKSIGTKAINYAIMLTIKTISPQISDLLENLEAIARFINSQNINDCKMGASLAAGIFPKTQASQQLACQARQMNGGGKDKPDFFTARYECSDEKNMMETNNKSEDGVLPAEYNLVWEALKKQSSGIEIAEKEFLMSLSGTIISRKGGGASPFFENKNTLIKEAKILDALIFGTSAGSFDVYKCDEEDKCLNPRITKKTFKPEQSMLVKVKGLMDSIANKIIQENQGQNQTLTASEIELATRTSVPIIKLISLNASLKGHGVTLTVEDYAEAVAFDYVVNYLESLIDFVYRALGQLEHTQLEGGTILKFKEEVRYVQKMLESDRVKSYERLNTLISVKKRTQQIETMVLNNFAEYRTIGGHNG